MNDGKMMADLALNGSAPEMRATHREGGGFNILCVGGSPHMWFGSVDEVSVFEWLGKRGGVILPSLRWSDLAIDDDVAGIDICTTDGVHVRINDVSAWELHKWLGVKLGRTPSERPPARCHDGSDCDGDKCEAASTCIGEQQSEEDRAADRQKMLEDAHGGKVMRLRDLPAQYDELRSWIGCKYGARHIMAVLDDEYVRLKWYTRDSVIGVVVRLPDEKRPQGYIGATASGRAPRVGETWTRGNDLADGPYCKETWDRVVVDAAFWDVLPLEIDLKASRVGLDPAEAGAEKTVVTLNDTLDAITLELIGSTEPGVSAAVDKLLAESYEKWATAAYDRGERLPAGMDSRIITDDPAFDKHGNSTYPSGVTVGSTHFSISRMMTPICTSYIANEAKNIRSNIVEMVRNYVDELARWASLGMSDGATRPLIHMDIVAGTARYYVYGFNFVKIVRTVENTEPKE